MFVLFGKSDRRLQQSLGLVQFAAKYLQLAERIVNTGDMDVIFFQTDIERPVDHLLGLGPLADKHQVDAEIVVSDDRIEGVLGLVKKLDRFFETGDAVLRTSKKPIRTGHIRVELAEHERRRVVADDLDTELKILERLFAVAFLVIAVCDLAISLGHAEPVAVFAKMLERLFAHNRGRSDTR